ncbi:Sushi, von Willebrand factor type A, EGF and pentraxin domain-containing protein 1 [Toxocara canis]|uniref:Sushi, von Willebrand factor type A, EGF and pentraxin domain-containing protein 1 n=1 Tax=Toxocara canis TaxID=6265 RepID=A0A0B2VYW2_TOXCA|nr:Sushi, von Willebrand factor type A, EGF and pentraxin domain-containing protein 1 [Toxocara canis]
MVSARLPLVSWTDASDVQLIYEPFNGTKLEIDEPLRVTVTAVDQHGNIAKCRFWYVAKVNDCPLWPINQTEFECTGSLTQRFCTRKNRCELEYPSGVQALSCKIYAKLVSITAQSCADTSWHRSEYLTNGSLLTVLFISRVRNVAAASHCADQFVTAIKVGSTVVKNPCEGFQVRWQTANYSVQCDDEQCPSGFYSTSNGCDPCPVGTYSDRVGLKQCKKCPYGLSTVNLGSFSVKLCYERCPPGYYSATGLAPCRACPLGFYQPGNASKDCIECRGGNTTASPGAASESDCAEKCMPGWFSQNGLQPCIACPFGFYQPNAGKTKCIRCPEGTVTLQSSATTLLQCRRLSCDDGMCHNGATCTDRKCKCANGYAGSNCGVAMNLCYAEYCLNGAQCFFDGNSTRCQCLNGFAGMRCERRVASPEASPLASSPCSDISLCPNGACISTGHSYICECHDGYKNVPHSKQLCVPLDSCDFHPCTSADCRHASMNALECPRHPGAAKMNMVASSGCQNNGTMTPRGCLCPPQFGGVQCEKKRDDICIAVGNKKACGTGGCRQYSNQFNIYYFCECRNEKTQSYNLYFTGRPSSKRIVSIPFEDTLLDEFSLCGWVKPGVGGFGDRPYEMTTTPFISLIVSRSRVLDEEILSISCVGVKLDNTLVAPFTMKTNVWNQICIRYSRDYMMSVSMNGQTVATSDRRIKHVQSQVRILLGRATSGAERFFGELSLIQLYHRVLSDAEVRNMTYDCQRWLKSQTESEQTTVIVKWNQFSTVSNQDPSVYTLYPGICVSSACLPGHSHPASTVYDKIPPTLVGCPSDMYVVSERRLTTVSWQPSAPEDIFFDNVLISDISSNYRSGGVFAWGEYHVMYVARDEAGNIGKCEFNVIVSPRNCTDPPDPSNGSANIVKLNNSIARRVAFLDCNVGYLFADKMPDFLTCDVMLANEKFGGNGFCITPNCTGELQMFSNCGGRTKRTTAMSRIDVSYVLTVNTTRSSIFSYINSSMYEQYGENSRAPTTEWICKDPDYQMLLLRELKSCVKCTVGYYLNNSVCVPCPENTYKNTEGNGPCEKCEEGKVTGTTGAIMASDCYNNCTPGTYYYRPTASCKRCELGTFQPEYGTIQCLACSPGSSTSGIGASSEAECNVTCGAGFYMGVNEKCVACPQGTYRPHDRQIIQCISCNIGFTTPTINSSHSRDCSVMNCPAGTFINDNVTGPISQDSTRLSQICLQCPIGYYQGAPSMRYCVLSAVTIAPTTAIASQGKLESPPWITWLIVATAGGIAALIFSSVVIMYRKRLRNFLRCCKNPDLKTMATTDYYRDTTYTYPIVTSVSPTTTVPQMIEIYNEIFTGLQKMADGSEDSRARDFEDVESTPQALTVDTTLRAVEKYGPKAIGMDSSGFPIDSADYERFSFGKQGTEYSGTFDSLIRDSELRWSEQSSLRRRFEAISEPLYNDAATHEWRRRISYSEFGRSVNLDVVPDYEDDTNYMSCEDADDDDDEASPLSFLVNEA